jgi:hypothetical protein
VIYLGGFAVKVELKVVDDHDLWMVFEGTTQKEGDVLFLLLPGIGLGRLRNLE